MLGMRLNESSLRTQGRRGVSDVLMIVTRDADLACDVVVARRELHAGAGRLLSDRRAIEFLPRRLVGRVGEAALGLEFDPPSLQLFLRDQDVGTALVEVDAHLVAVLEDR